MSKTIQNFYKETVSVAWTTGTGNFYVSAKPTPSAGWLVLSPNNVNLREIVEYTATGTDGTGDYVTVSVRGVGGTTEQTHTVSEPVRMNVTAEYWADIYADPTFTGTVTVPAPINDTDASTRKYVNDTATFGAPDASVTTKGISTLSTAPVSATSPIAVGDNDPRVPTTDEKAAMVGTSGTPSSTNKFVTDADTSATAVADKVVRADSSNKIDNNYIDSGTTASKIVQLDSSAKLPAVDGSNLTNLVKHSSGTATKDDNDASIVQNIAHGLGKIPSKVRITAYRGDTNPSLAETIYNGTTQSSHTIYSDSGATNIDVLTFTLGHYGSYAHNEGVVTFDATNIIITWTLVGSSGAQATHTMLWEAEG